MVFCVTGVAISNPPTNDTMVIVYRHPGPYSDFIEEFSDYLIIQSLMYKKLSLF